MPETALIQNWIFAGLSEPDQEALRPHMVMVFLPTGDTVNLRGQHVEKVYFPTTAEVANLVRTAEGKTTSSGMVGRNGVTGIAAALVNAPIGWDVHVTIAGHAWSLDASILRSLLKSGPTLAEAMLQHAHDNEVDVAQNAVCIAYHPFTKRLARWLLNTQDRTSLQEFHITQDDLSILLGSQRTTIVQSCTDLKAAGAISQARGRIKIVDRVKLKGQACSCYAAPVQH